MEARDVPEIVRNQASLLAFNQEAVSIFQGNIKPYVTELIKKQLSLQSAEQAISRLVPLNILPKIIDKLTNIYQTSVIRTVKNPSDQKLVDYYEKNSRMNSKFNCGNELYNLCGATLIQPYAYNKKPHVRAIPNDKFVVLSEDKVDPTNPTHVILIYQRGPLEQYYWVYSATEIYAVDSRGNRDEALMKQANVDGKNPIGRLPFVYGSSSEYSLLPCPDEDGLSIVKLIPVMLTDLNLASMFQCFSILYMINAKKEGVVFAPNAVWELNQPPDSDLKPEIGQLKPNVDYTEVLNLITTELSMWLGTKGIRASTVGGLDAQNYASGISKVIDEMDTFEARQKQVTAFQSIESKYWDLITNGMNEYWQKNQLIESVGQFSTGCEVTTQFAVQLPMQSRGQVVKDLALEVESGFISRKRAILKLNPELKEQDVMGIMKEIDEERVAHGMAEDEPGNPEGSETSTESTTS